MSSAASAHGTRFKAIVRVLWVILLLNLGVAAAKYCYGSLTGSLAMRTDGIASVFDGLSNVVGIVGIHLAAQPADDNHPYGHAKFETYASLAIGVSLLVAAFDIAVQAFSHLAHGVDPVTVDAGSYAVMGATLAVNIAVSLYERRAGARLKSEVLMADGLHTASDALVSVSVIISLILVQMGLPLADPVASFVVMAAILHSAWEIFRQASATLADEARIPTSEVEAVAEGVPGVRSVHRVRTRGTEGEVFVDLHVLVDPSMTILAAHDVGDEVERAIGGHWGEVVDVMVHIEPDTARERIEEEG